MDDKACFQGKQYVLVPAGRDITLPPSLSAGEKTARDSGIIDPLVKNQAAIEDHIHTMEISSETEEERAF